MGLHSMSTLDSRLVLMLKQLNKYLNHFPRSEKYGLSLQIRTAAYEVYGLVVESRAQGRAGAVRLATLLLLAALAGCGQSAPLIERTEALIHLKLVDQINYKPGYVAHGLSRCANGVCVVEIRRDRYPECVEHEVRHAMEGPWHGSRPTTCR